MNNLVLIFLGAGLGGVARFSFGRIITAMAGTALPFATLGVNVFGGFLMGIAAVLLTRENANQEFIRNFIMIGLLGGFTTFSAFSLESVALFENANYLGLFTYIALSVILSIGAVFIGMAIGRHLG